MSYFPLCINLTEATVLLVGNGPQIQEKREKLLPFGACLVQTDTLAAQQLEPRPALVVIGDLDEAEAERCSLLCRERNIPVNVVDIPRLCTFYFPALISRGDLTVAVTTGGKSPGFAASLRRRLEAVIPARSGEILDWLWQFRETLQPVKGNPRARRLLKAAAERCLTLGRPLTEEEIAALEP